MDRIKTLGFVTLGVADLEAAVDFYARVVRLEISERRPGVVFMSGGREHHWLRLEESPRTGIHRASYEAVDAAALDAIKADLDARGISSTEGGGFGTDRVMRWLRFVDPAGVELELFTSMAELPTPIEPNGIALREMLHTVWEVANFDETRLFYQEVLGFKVSDTIEDSLVFLRCADGYHHSLAMSRTFQEGPEPKFSHFCILVDSIDDVMRFRHNAVGLGLELDFDLLRHPTSGSMGVYVKEPMHGFSIEFCTDHERITDDDYVPREISLGPGVIDIWQNPLPPPRVDTKVPFFERLAMETEAP